MPESADFCRRLKPKPRREGHYPNQLRRLVLSCRLRQNYRVIFSPRLLRIVNVTPFQLLDRSRPKHNSPSEKVCRF